jgi:hypothetical protein
VEQEAMSDIRQDAELKDVLKALTDWISTASIAISAQRKLLKRHLPGITKDDWDTCVKEAQAELAAPQRVDGLADLVSFLSNATEHL